MIKSHGFESLSRWRKRIGLIALFGALALLLLPYVGTDVAFGASPPDAEDLSPVAQLGTPITIHLSGSDPDGDSLLFTIVTLPTNGGILADGAPITTVPADISGSTVTFTGASTGNSVFAYRVSDGDLSSADAKVTVNVIEANLDPIALDLSVTSATSTVTIYLSGSDAEGDTVTFDIESVPTNGVLFDGATQIFPTSTPFGLSGRTVTYAANSTPSADSFTYTAVDASLVSSALATVTIASNSGSGGPPVAADVSVSDDVNVDIKIALPGYDPDDDSLTFYITSDPSPGGLRDGVSGSPINNAGSTRKSLTSNLVEYRPTPSTSGIVTFDYEIDAGGATSVTRGTVTVTLGHSPDADDLSPVIDEDIKLDVLLSGSHPTDEALTFIVTVPPTHGSLSAVSSNVVTYTPDANYNGSDSFDYIVRDGGLDSATATVSLTINGLNDAPVAVNDDNTSLGVAPDEDNVLSVPARGLLSNDTDVDVGHTLTLTVLSVQGNPAAVGFTPVPTTMGALVFVNFDGSFAYIPSTAMQSLAQGDLLVDSFVYVIRDLLGAQSAATVTLTVAGVNDAPVATGELLRITFGGSENIDVLANEQDIDGDPLTVTITGGPSFGTATVRPDNTVDYTHDGSGTAADSFTYVANDGHVDSNPATVTVEILGVNTTNDIDDGTCNGVHCSLREAINLANSDPSFDTIAFGIPAAMADANGDYVIRLKTLLPTITASGLVIDGTTQTGFAAVGRPVVVLENVASVTRGLTLNGANNTIRGLVINKFWQDGIRISGPGGNRIEGNHIGTDPAGLLDKGNRINGVYIVDSPDNVVGGTASGTANLISGNDSVGVRIHSTDVIKAAIAINNRVEGNLIGTNISGTGAIGNAFGIAILSTDFNFIGTSSTSTPNVISGNNIDGIILTWGSSDNNEIQNNYIGTDITGSADLGNNRYGVNVETGNDNLIGGDTLSKRNVISGNGNYGVRLKSGTSDTKISGNIIGLDISGTQRIGNWGGVFSQLSNNNVIGGTTVGERNIISANTAFGIYVERASDNTIQGNFIGTDITGTANRGNGGTGILIDGRGGAAKRNLIGSDSVTVGACDNGCNTIAFNGDDGVFVTGEDTNATENPILGNSIFSNGGLGINLEKQFLKGQRTPNDLVKGKSIGGVVLFSFPDADVAANRLQNFPKINQARLDGNDDLSIRFDVPTFPGLGISEYPLWVEFFKLGIGLEPMEFLGRGTYDESDFLAGFSVALLTEVTVENDDQIVATATDDNGNTSELSDIAIVGVIPPYIVNATGDDGDIDNSDGVCDTGGVGNANGQSPCTFRAALEQSEAISGPDTILFDIPVPPVDPDIDPPLTFPYNPNTGVFTFRPQTRFDLITDELVIDATTQPGYAGTPLIEINGVDAGNQAIGLHITGGNTTIKGLAINGFDSDGIRLQFLGGNLIEANFIGTDAAGLSTDRDADPDLVDETANGGDGVRISRSPDNTIINNVISGNSSNGVTIFGIESSGNLLQDNRIGADVNGFAGLPNVGDGVFILDASDNNLRGGNTIAFNLGRGVAVDAGSRNALNGNAIFGNSALGIDLGNDGPTSNDPADADSDTANNLQNFPFINKVRVQVDLSVEVEYSVDSALANSAYPISIDFFRAASGGQGRVLLGGDTYSAGDFGAGGFKTVDMGSALVLNLVRGDEVVGLATDADGNTSEFSVIKGVEDFGLGGHIFVVDSTEDGADAVIDGTCDNGSGACTLRAAIQESNISNPGFPRLDRIDFAIGSGPATISVGSPLPVITDAVIIDGTSQPGFATNPIITLDGSGAGSNADGLTITGGETLVRGLVINGFRSDGIVLKTGGNNIIVGNFIGTDATGLTEAPNFQVGVRIDNSPDNRIGGSTDSDRNVISGNQQRGVLILNSNSSGNMVSGNFIGVGVDGLTIIDNGINGIRIIDAPANIIGGVEPGEGNVISGNSEHGVLILSSNPLDVLAIGNLVQGNFIGTDLTGSVDLGNLGTGVRIENADNNIIGGSASDLANNITGGLCAGACNTIAFNGDDGIHLLAGIGNSFLSNAIYQNTGLGIDLNAPSDDDDLDQGITPNDLFDSDSGANDLQNFPVFAAVASARIDASDSLIIEYSVDTDLSSPVTIQFFIADTDDQEGATYVGSDTYASAGVKTAIIPNASAVGVVDGDVLLATATDHSGSTSEFVDVPVSVVEAIFFVNTNNDRLDVNPGDGICDDGTGNCTLRAAIMEANAVSGMDAIHFNLPTASAVSPLLILSLNGGMGPLPAVTEAIVIDGTTQLGFSKIINEPTVVLNGSAITGPGLEISAGNSTVRGLKITSFDGHGILLNTDADAVGGNLIEGNLIGDNDGGSGIFIDGVPGNLVGGTTSEAANKIEVNGVDGVTISGTAAVNNVISGNALNSNGRSGLVITDAPNNMVGGTDSGAANVFIGNAVNGITISGAEATGNAIEGNFIGTDDADFTGVGNQANGVVISGAHNNMVGGTTPAAANVISGNTLDGVVISSGATGNTVQGNVIGTTADGSTALANSGRGVLIADASGNTIGGTASGAANLISGNALDGVRITGSGSSSNLVLGNLIGTDATGEAALGNTGSGLVISGGQNNVVGGSISEAANIISGNGENGVVVTGGTATGNLIQGNFIGTDASSAINLGNVLAGVHITGNAANNVIGGLTGVSVVSCSGVCNVIANNGGDGVYVESGVGNAIQGNSIFANGSGGDDLGIDLGADGRTTNDGGDADGGANNLQNFPVISSALINGHDNLILRYSIDSPATSRVEFFKADAGGSQGETLLGTDDYTSSVAATELVNLGMATGVGISSGDIVVATATSSADTSEFSDAATVAITAIFTVNVTSDQVDSLPGDGQCNNGTGGCTLRAAIEESNATAGANTITFSVSGTITLDVALGPLPTSTDPVIIDASSRSVTLDGSNLPFGNGLVIAGGDSVVLGLRIVNFPGNGIVLFGNGSGVVVGNANGGTILEDNQIGANGASDQGNGEAGVLILNSINNVIGGLTAGDGNLISGNDGDGVRIEGVGSTGNVLLGNLIGTDSTGTSAIANGGAGVLITGDADGNVIGGSADVTVGTCDGACNTIAFNGGAGVEIQSGDSNTVSANSIFTNAALGIQAGASNVPVIKGARVDANNDLFLTFGIGSPDLAVFPLTVEFFVADGDGEEGETYLGTVTYDDVTLLNSTANLGDVGVLLGQTIVAAATNDNGATTNISAGVIVTTAAVFVVDSNLDTPDVSHGDGLCDDGSGAGPGLGLCTLRAALEEANAVAGVDEINFALDPADLTILLGSALPDVIDPLRLDGTTQAGYAGAPIVILDGSNLGSVNGLNLTASGSNIKGMAITNFGGSGILIASSDNVIGGSAGEGNEIHGNTGDGVRIASGVDNSIRANSIHDNVGLGINLVGLLDLSDGTTENDIDDDDDLAVGPNNLQNFPEISDVRIDAVGNLIVEYSIPSLPANSDYPITAEFFAADISGQEGKIFLGTDAYTDLAQGTQIANLGQVSIVNGQLVLGTATDATGETSEFGLPNDAVQVPAFVVDSIADSDDINSIDGVCDVGDGTCTLRAAISQANVIAGVDGIQFNIAGAGPHVITLTSQLPQVTDAIVIDGFSEPDYSGTPVIEIDGSSIVSVGLDIVSGDSIVRGVTLRGFTSHAIVLDTGGDNELQGNVIGTAAQGNGGSGVFITGASSGNVVGGTGAGEGNIFVNNQGDGVTVESGLDNAVLANAFESTGGLAIDLANDGATANDVDLAVPANEDIDAGANNLQNFPVLSDARFVAGDLEMTYSVSSYVDNSTYPLHVEFYARDISGALSFLGSDTYDAPDAQASKTASISITAINSTDTIVATATDADGQGSTSEFSAAIASPPQADLSVLVTSSSDSVSSGSSVAFTINVVNNGPSDTTDVAVSNVMIAGLSFVSTSPSTPTQGSYDNATDIWTIGNLANGESALLGVEFNTATQGVFTSQPVVSANEFDSDASNNTGNKPVTVTSVSAPAPSAGGGGRGPVVEKAIGHTHDGITMRFTAIVGEGNPSPQTLGVFNPGRGTLEWSLISGVEWLSTSPRSGKSRNATPTDIAVNVDATDLAAGEYSGTISIVAGEVSNSPQVIEVLLTVQPPPPEDQRIAFSPDVLTITAVEGDPNPALASFEVWNAGDLTLDWSAEADVDWLSFLPGGGTSQGERVLVTASADVASFAAGTYSANVTINADVAVNAPQIMPVELVVLPPPPVIDTDQGSYTIIAPESGPNPGRQVVLVVNAGGRDMQWSAGVDQPWLTLDVNSGVSSPDAPAELGLMVDVGSLTLGEYSATLEIIAADATNSPLTVNVTLVVDLPTDTDEDGVPDIIEDDGPNGGDSNRDNVPDSQQENVASVPDAVAGTFVTLVSTSGTLLQGVRALENPSPEDAPSRVSFPLGFYEYSIAGIDRGESAQVVYTLSDGAGFNANKFYKYGPTPSDPAPHWYEFTYDGETGVELLGDRIVMHLVDGQRGDDDLTDNGLIVTVGAPADDTRADLVMTVEGVRDMGTLAQPLNYTVTVVNLGPAIATNVTVSQPLPSGFELVTATPSKGVCNPGDGVQCNLRSLQIGESASVEFIVRTTVVISEPFPYETSVAGSNLDSNTDNNVVTVDMTVADPTLALAETSVRINKIEGNPTSEPHKLGITNSGPSGSVRWSVVRSCNTAESSDAFPSWLELTPGLGVITSGDGNVLVGVDISALSPGKYTAAFAVSDAGARLGCQNVEVLLEVLPAIGSARQNSVNLQQWELQGISGLVRGFFESMGVTSSETASGTDNETDSGTDSDIALSAKQVDWFKLAATLAGKLESDKTILLSVPSPSDDLGTSLTSLSRFGETLGHWSGQGPFSKADKFETVENATNDLINRIDSILSGKAEWDSNGIGLIQISDKTNEKLFVLYNRQSSELLVHFDIYGETEVEDGDDTPWAGQIDVVIPVEVKVVEGLGDELVAGDPASLYARDTSVISVGLGSPGELRVSDEIGRVTGTVNKEITINIPNTTFFAGKVFVMLPTDAQALTYTYDVVGTENIDDEEDRLYSIDVILHDREGVDKLFRVDGVDISINAVHSYTVDWPNLDMDEGRGWLRRVYVESNGNFVLSSEFPPVVRPTNIPQWVWPEAAIAVVVVLLLALVIFWIVISWSEPIREKMSNGLTPVRRFLARFGINLKLPRLPEPSWSRYIRF